MRTERAASTPADEGADAERFGARGRSRWTAEVERFNLHAGVTIAADDRAGRERLCRYILRPPFSAERFSRLPDGRVAYRLARPGLHGHSHRILTPLELMARLAALIPPPRLPQLRYHGVLAPHAAWRRAIVPTTPRRPCPRPHAARPPAQRTASPQDRGTTTGNRDRGPATCAAPSGAAPAHVGQPAATPGDAVARGPAAGARLAAVQGGRRIEWAALLRRTFALDPLACPRCGGRLRFVATVTAPDTIRRILTHLGESADGPVPSRAWDPVLYEP